MTNTAKIIKFKGDTSRLKINSEAHRVIDSAGWVYILVNECMPGLVKIGYTANHPDIRAKQLSGATGVPVPFKVFMAQYCYFAKDAELLLHEELINVRVNESREFFKLPLIEAEKALHNVITDITEHFCSNEFNDAVYDRAVELNINTPIGDFIHNYEINDGSYTRQEEVSNG